MPAALLALLLLAATVDPRLVEPLVRRHRSRGGLRHGWGCGGGGVSGAA